MKHTQIILLGISLFVISLAQGQKKFAQIEELIPTPNEYRNAAGAPGYNYYQQQADYKMDITLDDKTSRLYGTETITYTNNSPDELEYLWVQLDQNVRAKDSKSPLIEPSGATPAELAGDFVGKYMGAGFDGGFKIDYVKDKSGKQSKALSSNAAVMGAEP